MIRNRGPVSRGRALEAFHFRMATINIHLVDAHKFDVVMAIERALSVGDKGITGVKDMVDRVEESCNGGHLVGELRIVGHGNTTGQYIGGEFINDMNVHLYAIQWERLAKMFDKGSGLLTLGGCKVGQAVLLMKKLSHYLDVPVRAWRTFQNPIIPGDEGGETRCTVWSCTRTEKPFTMYAEDARNAFNI